MVYHWNLWPSGHDLKEIAKEEKELNLKSNGEKYIFWYLRQLKLAGYIEWFLYEPDVLTIAEPVFGTWQQQMKTKVKKHIIEISSPLTYTPDFKIKWSDKAEGIFFYTNSTVSKSRPIFFLQDDTKTMYLEVKPQGWDYQNMTRLARDKIRYLRSQGINIDIVKHMSLFKKTFTPNRYLVTDKSAAGRKLKHQPRMLDQFIKQMI